MKVSEVDFKCLRSGVMPVGIPRATASREAMPGVRMASACKMDDANQMARTIMSNPNHPQSPQQRYCLTLVTISAIL